MSAETITAAVVPWGQVEPGWVVLSRGQIVTVREVWQNWEKGVGLLVDCPASPAREEHVEHREEHADSLTAVISRVAAPQDGEVSR
ncbi:hypothetical protein ABZ897_00615 [Nonomuraea sp. NPDC046802]|uniref:hypothetical protein n=1 Tax=Nonomuraea sp. NPDC046802 TaxID=3154919 RepID=UPI0033F2DDCE